MTTLGYEIRGKDGFYVRRQIVANTLQLVVGHDDVAGGLWVEWAEDENAHEVHNHARRMIRQARKEGLTDA